MSYEHGTPHYNLPQTVGSDTRDWFDTNEAFADIDAAIYGAGQTAESAMADLTEVKSDVQGLKDADIAMTGRVDGIEGRVSTSELKIGRLENAVADDKQDLMDAICSIEEASATAAYAHATGGFFWYNNTLYKATTNIAIGQQIVPDTNCKTTNITTELLEGGGDTVNAEDVVCDNATSGATSTDAQGQLDELFGLLTANGKKFEADYQDSKYGFTVDGTFHPFGSGAGVVLLGTYSTGTSIDVSAYGASSTDEFLVVPDLSTWSYQFNQGDVSYIYGVSISVANPTLALSQDGNTLTVGGCTSNCHIGVVGTVPDRSATHSYKVYYVGTVTEA